MENLRILSVKWTISGIIITDLYSRKRKKITCYSASFALGAARNYLANELGLQITGQAEAKGIAGYLLTTDFKTELK